MINRQCFCNEQQETDVQQNKISVLQKKWQSNNLCNDKKYDPFIANDLGKFYLSIRVHV